MKKRVLIEAVFDVDDNEQAHLLIEDIAEELNSCSHLIDFMYIHDETSNLQRCFGQHRSTNDESGLDKCKKV